MTDATVTVAKTVRREPAAWKTEEVEKIRQMVKGKRVVGVFDLTGMPSSQLQEIRKKLRGKAELVVTKRLLIKKALEQTHDLKELDGFLNGPCGLLVSGEEPFKLYNLIKKNKSKALAKPGAVAPADIVVPAGETDMPAGPALAELKAVKIEVKLDKGKIVVSKDSVVAKKGEKITLQVASVLAKLGLKPMEVGLRIPVLCEKGVAYTASVLDIDEQAVLSQLGAAHMGALSLAVAAAYPAAGVTPLLLSRAAQNAFSLAANAGIFTKQTASLLLSKGFTQASALTTLINAKQGG